MNTTKKSLLAAMVGLFAAGGMGAVQAQEQVGESARAQGVLDEIVITASRREKSLNDAALSVAAIGGEEISRRNLSEMNDYLRTVPGANLVELGVGTNFPVIRGIGVNPQVSGFGSTTTTGIYFGEVPLSGLTLFGGSSDIRMVDLNRVEVLRGPQGTLFGSGSLSGAVRNIPNAPNLNEVEGNIKTSYSGTSGFGDGNSKFEAVINIPLIDDELAVRAVAYRHDTSGYIKNIGGDVLAADGEVFPGQTASESIALNGGTELLKNQSGIGDAEFTGGRITALWTPTDELRITLQHIYQDAEQEGQPYVEFGNGGGYTQVTYVYGNQQGVEGEDSGHWDEINITNLVAEYDLGKVSLLSSSTWMDTENLRNQDQSTFGIGPSGSLFGLTKDVYIQEFRAVSKLDGPFQFVGGVYYEEIESDDPLDETWALTDEVAANFGLPIGDRRLSRTLDTSSVEQLSVYGEVSYDFNDQMELTLGARRFDYERLNNRFTEGVFANISPRTEKTDETGTNFRANLSYSPNEDMLFYTQWAEGFRLGGTNAERPDCDADSDGLLDGTDAPLKRGFDSDTTENFELGAKLTLLDKRLQLNAAVYQLDWDGIPVFIFSSVCNGGTTVNAGAARSQGLEIEAIYQVTENLRINWSGDYIDAELTKDTAIGSDGDRLPSSSEYSYNIGLQYDFDWAGHASFIGGDYSYVGEFYSRLAENGVEAGDYGQFNMSAGVIFDSFSVELFGHNLTDEDALTHVDTITLDGRAYRLRPRTIGLNVGYQF